MPEQLFGFTQSSAKAISRTVRDHFARINRLELPGPFLDLLDDSAGGGGTLLKITTDRVCGGVYGGYEVTQNSDDFDTGDATYDDDAIESETGTDTVTIINLAERGLTTHGLTFGTPTAHMFIGLLAGFSDENGKAVYLINALDLGCS